MALTKAAIVTAAANEAKGILGALPGLAADAAAQYVKQGTPSGLIPNVGVALARQACRRHAQQPNLAPDAVSAGLERVCRPYLDDIGYGAGPSLNLPFRDGQCFGGLYRFNFTYNTDQGPRNSIVVESAGRLLGTYIGATQPNQLRPIGFERQQQPGGQVERINMASVNASTTPASRLENVVNIGGPSGCGNPPTDYTEPTTPPGPVINIEPIIIVPFVDIDAGVEINIDGTIDITVDGVEINIDPFGDRNEGGGGGGVDGGDLVPGGGAPGPSADATNGGAAGGDAPPGQELVGVRVEVLEAPIGFNQYSNNPAVVYRGIGYTRMGYPNNLALDVAGSAVISPQFFIAPVRGLTSWEHRANLGFINRCTPFYRELPQ